MRWNKPKNQLIKTATLFSSISFIVAMVWLFFLIIWNNYPTLINKIDNYIPNTYQNKINSLHDETKTAKTPVAKYKAYVRLLKSLKGTTKLHTTYSFVGESYNYIIDYLRNNQKLNLALETAKKWQRSYPYDFSAKFKYINLLTKKDINLARIYTEKLYQKYYDIFEVSSRYFSLLLDSGYFNKALHIANEQSLYFAKNADVGFNLFFKDRLNSTYTAKNKIEISEFTRENNKYHIELLNKFDQLSGLRFDIEKVKIGSSIKAIKFTIKEENKTYTDVYFKPLNHILQKPDGSFVVTGGDPYFEILLPKELINSEKKLSISVDLEVFNNPELSINSLINNKEWQLFYSQSVKFSEDKSVGFYLTQTNKHSFNASFAMLSGSYKYIRVDLPSYINMELYDFEILFNKNIKLKSNEALSFHSLEPNNNNLNVINNDPYLVFKLDQNTVIEHISIVMKLGEDF